MVSTLASGMTSRIALAAIALFAGLGYHTTAAESESSFFEDSCGESVVPLSLAVTGQVERICTEVLGYAYSGSAIQHHNGAGRTVWVLKSRGKHGPITAGLVVENKRIRTLRVLADRERRGRAIRSGRYLRQFEGIGLHANGRLDRSIDGITGATISSSAVSKMAQLALRLDVFIKDGQMLGEG